MTNPQSNETRMPSVVKPTPEGEKTVQARQAADARAQQADTTDTLASSDALTAGLTATQAGAVSPEAAKVLATAQERHLEQPAESKRRSRFTPRRRVSGSGTPTTDGPLKAEVPASGAGRTWVALSIGMVLLVLLLIFIIQNMQQASVHFFGWSAHFPAGIGFLISALIGAAIVFLIGTVRIVQLRQRIKHPGNGDADQD